MYLAAIETDIVSYIDICFTYIKYIFMHLKSKIYRYYINAYLCFMLNGFHIHKDNNDGTFHNYEYINTHKTFSFN